MIPQKTIETKNAIFSGLNRDTFDHKNQSDYTKQATRGLSEELVRKISATKHEPDWMLQKRLEGLRLFYEKAMPNFGPDLSHLNFAEIIFYAAPGEQTPSKSWEDVSPDIKKTFERLGIPEAEKKMLAGVGAQYESSVVYHRLKEQWEKLGVIFEDMDVAVQKYPDLVQKYFMTRCVPVN